MRRLKKRQLKNMKHTPDQRVLKNCPPISTHLTLLALSLCSNLIHLDVFYSVLNHHALMQYQLCSTHPQLPTVLSWAWLLCKHQMPMQSGCVIKYLFTNKSFIMKYYFTINVYIEDGDVNVKHQMSMQSGCVLNQIPLHKQFFHHEISLHR